MIAILIPSLARQSIAVRLEEFIYFMYRIQAVQCPDI